MQQYDILEKPKLQGQKKRVSGFQGLREKGGNWFLKGQEENLGSEGNVLYLDCSGYMTVYGLPNSGIFTKKKRIFFCMCMVCQNSGIFTKKREFYCVFIIPNTHNFRKSSKWSLISLLNLLYSGILDLSLTSAKPGFVS